MNWKKRTFWSLTVVMAMLAMLTLASTGWAKKPDNPGGGKPGGGDDE